MVITLYSWKYWVINPDQDVIDGKMSPQDPVFTIRQVIAGPKRDGGERLPPSREKSLHDTDVQVASLENIV